MKDLKKHNLIVRVSDDDSKIFNTKSNLFGMSKSEMLRESAKSYWTKKFDPDSIYKEYLKSDESSKDDIITVLAEYMHRMGYPHNKLDSREKEKQMGIISNTKSVLLEDNHLQVNTVGLALANSFHPHMVKVKCMSGYRTPYEQFSDINLLKDCIKRWMELGNKPSFSGMRRILRTRDGVRSVVNFKPAVAKYFYNTYCPNNGKVLDPCAGYGGRLSACISTNKGIFYHGIDPHGPTAVGNMEMASFFKMRDWRFDFRFDLGCAEDIMPSLPENQFNLVFTSPPFFNTEKYSDHPMQSWKRYPEYDDWKYKFFGAIIENSYRVLIGGGFLILNVKNYRNAPIADDVVSLSSEIGFNLKKTYHMRLPNSEFRLKEGSKWHTEPIFVFEKT